MTSLLITSGSLQTWKGVEILGRAITPHLNVNPKPGRDEQWIKVADLLLRRRLEMEPTAEK
jgi:hypothetical protein